MTLAPRDPHTHKLPETATKRRFLDLLRERFNSAVRYNGCALKWNTVIEQKTVELGRFLIGRSSILDFSQPSPTLHRTDDRDYVHCSKYSLRNFSYPLIIRRAIC